MGRSWPSTAGALADQLVADVVARLEDLEATYAPGLVLPVTFGGHVVGPDVAADLAFTLGLLHADGIEQVAGRSVVDSILDVLRAIEAQGINGGIDLSEDYPELGNALLTCATETRTVDEIENYATHLDRITSRRSLDPPCAEKVAG